MMTLGQKVIAIGTICVLELVVFLFVPILGLLGLVPAVMMIGVILTR